MVGKVLYLGSREGLEATREVLGDVAEVVHVDATADAVRAALPTACAILDASMRVRITDVMVSAAPELRIISCATTGSDQIERRGLMARGIPVRTLKEDGDLLRNITPAAELTWALVMGLARRLVPAVAHTRAGLWVRESFPGLMLNGRRLGLVGCGRIGGWVARYGQAFGLSVVAYDPYLEVLPPGVERAWDLEGVLEQVDVLSVHVHLSDETRGLVSRVLLERCKPGMLLINTSRGAIVDEVALLDGLRSGRIGGAGLDVLDGEPDIADHPLIAYAREHDNLLITPHCGGFSPDAVRIVCRHAAQKMLGVLRD